jgi:diacylglycerol kinase family enzyme
MARGKRGWLLVGNPTAQSGRNASRIELARALFKKRRAACDFLATEPAGRTIAAVTAAVDGGGHRGVIAMGGDGTFREVAAGLLASKRRDDVALGMLPTGTANDQGKSFGLDADEESLERNVEVVLLGNETRLDAGVLRSLDERGREIGSAVFFDSAGWGISARVLARRNRDRERVEKHEVLREVYRDQLVYAGALLKTFLESYVVDDKFVAHALADDVVIKLEGLTDLIVKNTRIYAGAWIFDRSARHDDGQFEVVPFRGRRDSLSQEISDH